MPKRLFHTVAVLDGVASQVLVPALKAQEDAEVDGVEGPPEEGLSKKIHFVKTGERGGTEGRLAYMI
jgi:hypothetical protein